MDLFQIGSYNLFTYIIYVRISIIFYYTYSFAILIITIEVIIIIRIFFGSTFYFLYRVDPIVYYFC